MAQYPDDVEIFLPGGVVVRGRQAVADAFAGMVKRFSEGGLLGVTFTAEHVFTVGDTVNVQWKADAPFLKEPYRGADTYVTRGGLLAAQVSTFDMDRLKSLHSNEKRRMQNEYCTRVTLYSIFDFRFSF